MANDKINDLAALPAFVVDFGVSDLGSGGEPPSGVYKFTVKEAGFQKIGDDFKLALTLDGVGARDTWDNVSMPTDPNSKHAELQQKALATFLRCLGVVPAEYAQKAQIDGNWLKANVIGKAGSLWYEAREKDASGTAVEGSYKEITYLTAAMLAKVNDGSMTITRYKKAAGPTATANSLGSPAPASLGGVAPVVAPVIAAPVVASAPVVVSAPVIAAPVIAGPTFAPQPPAAVGVAPVPVAPMLGSFGVPPVPTA
jgi:hypothetical protein